MITFLVKFLIKNRPNLAAKIITQAWIRAKSK